MRSRVKHKLDYSDYLAAPDDGRRYEILSGDLQVTACPSPLHQWVAGRLFLQLERYFHDRGLVRVFFAPLAVILTNQDIVEPDLLVVEDARQITDRGIEGPPLIVVEILSPSTRTRDEGLKALRYAELGVPHYWIVDPEAQSLRCHGLVGREYEVLVEAQGGETLHHPHWSGLAIDLAVLWRVAG